MTEARTEASRAEVQVRILDQALAAEKATNHQLRSELRRALRRAAACSACNAVSVQHRPPRKQKRDPAVCASHAEPESTGDIFCQMAYPRAPPLQQLLLDCLVAATATAVVNGALP